MHIMCISLASVSMNCWCLLKPSSALKVIVWSNLVWGMRTLRSAFAALHMISVLYPSENIQSSIVKIDIYVFNYVIFVESDH